MKARSSIAVVHPKMKSSTHWHSSRKGIGSAAWCVPTVPSWQYVQMVKQRENGRVVGIHIRVIFGDPVGTLELPGQSTAYVERTHLTMRLFNGRLTRKTLGFSKVVEMYRASAAWEDLVYNLARSVKTLRIEVLGNPKRRWKQRSPAMASGLTDHIWTVKELLKTVVLPKLNNT